MMGVLPHLKFEPLADSLTGFVAGVPLSGAVRTTLTEDQHGGRWESLRSSHNIQERVGGGFEVRTYCEPIPVLTSVTHEERALVFILRSGTQQ